MSKFVRKREHLHDAMSRDGWILPSKHSGICTTTFMLNVRAQEIFCLNSSIQFAAKKCFTPPPKDILRLKLEQRIVELEATGRLPEDMKEKVYRLIGHLRLR